MKKNFLEYDILHVLWFNDTKFYDSLVKMFSESIIPNINMSIIFVTPYKNVYEQLKEYDCVYFVSEKEILRLLGKSKLIFLHPNSMSKLRTIFLPKRIANRIVWRTWGHDIRIMRSKNPIKIVVYKLYKRKINQFLAIGVDCEFDVVNVCKVFGNKIRTIQLNYYGTNEQYDSLKRVALEKNDESNVVRVMIGHNGGPADNHLILINRLKKFKNQNVVFSFPLSYGNKDYIKQVKTKALEAFGTEKVEFLEDFMPYEEFARYIKNVDVALLDQEYSNALGNLEMLIYFSKKIFVNRKGDFAKVFNSKKLKVNYCDEIDKMDYDSFIRYNGDEADYYCCIENLPLTKKDAALIQWQNVLKDLTKGFMHE